MPAGKTQISSSVFWIKSRASLENALPPYNYRQARSFLQKPRIENHSFSEIRHTITFPKYRLSENLGTLWVTVLTNSTSITGASNVLQADVDL